MFVSGVYSNQFDELMNIAELINFSGAIGKSVIEDKVRVLKNEMWRLYFGQWLFITLVDHVLDMDVKVPPEVLKKDRKIKKNLAKKWNYSLEQFEQYLNQFSYGEIADHIPYFEHMEDFAKTHNATKITGFPIFNFDPVFALSRLQNIEKVMLKEDTSKIPFKSLSQYKVLFKYNNYVWVDLETNQCSLEAKATGHCGTATYPESTLLSLRKIETVSNKKYFVPKVTIELRVDGYIAQCKGTKRGGESNVPVAPEFVSYVWDLIKNYKPIQGVLYGEEYSSVPLDDMVAMVSDVEVFIKEVMEKRNNFDYSGIIKACLEAELLSYDENLFALVAKQLPKNWASEINITDDLRGRRGDLISKVERNVIPIVEKVLLNIGAKGIGLHTVNTSLIIGVPIKLPQPDVIETIYTVIPSIEDITEEEIREILQESMLEPEVLFYRHYDPLIAEFSRKLNKIINKGSLFEDEDTGEFYLGMDVMRFNYNFLFIDEEKIKKYISNHMEDFVYSYFTENEEEVYDLEEYTYEYALFVMDLIDCVSVAKGITSFFKGILEEKERIETDNVQEALAYRIAEELMSVVNANWREKEFGF